jgi:hypothetical protein
LQKVAILRISYTIRKVSGKPSAIRDDDNSIHFNYFNEILVYLRANLTAQRPVTLLARLHGKTQK